MVQRNADGISGIILIGSESGKSSESNKSSEGCKRKTYFEKAAADAGIRLSFYDWNEFPFAERDEDIRSSIVKIDAPEWESYRLKELDELTDQYREQLLRLSRMPFGAFFNHPCDIAEALDKRKCKKRLTENGVAVTKMYDETFSHRDELLDFMRENRVYQVFLKPMRGSGAAGVTALRFSPGRGCIALYTCAALDQGEIVNTKKLYRLEGENAGNFLDKLLELDCVVEKWYRKAAFQEYCYDLRVVIQDNQVDYILPRLSKGPITNLHLNNHSMEFEKLNLDKTVMESISKTCIRAAGCYPGLKSIGMDVLLEKESLEPHIIEMNAQGDLLHKDIYNENRIYKRQIEIMQKMQAKQFRNGNVMCQGHCDAEAKQIAVESD